MMTMIWIWWCWRWCSSQPSKCHPVVHVPNVSQRLLSAGVAHLGMRIIIWKHHHQQHIIIRIHLVVWRPMFRSHCYLQQWFSKYWSLWICAKDQKVQQIHDNHQNDTMTMTIMMMLTSWSYWWHQDDTITMTTMTIITNHEKPHNHDDDTRTMTIMTIPTILTSWSPRLAAALQMESHHRSWPSMYSSHWCLYMYLKVYLKG